MTAASESRTAEVYLVDDYDDLIVVTEKLLQAERVEIALTCYRSSEDLLKELQASDAASVPDLLIIDLNMPRLPGLDLIRALRRLPHCAGIVVGVCSGSSDPADVERALAAGAAFYATKPLNRQRLAEICGQVESLHLLPSNDNSVRLCRVA